MKLLSIFIAGMFLTTAVYAQRIAMPTTPVTDSVKAKRLSKNKMQEKDGIRMGTARNIMENLRRAPQFSILFKAIQAAGLYETFKSKGPITFFAPTNQAFLKLPRGRLDTFMKPKHALELSNLLTCHAIAGHVSAKDLTKQINSGNGKAVLTTIGGCKITAALEGDHIVLTDESGNKSIIQTDDLEQSNGLIHVINGIIVPKPKLI